MYRHLPQFLEQLGAAGELARVDGTVDPQLEVAEITDRVAKSSNIGLIFGSVKGFDTPLATNLFGNESRTCLALGAKTIEEARSRVAEALDATDPTGWLGRLTSGSQGNVWQQKSPRTARSGPCQQVVRLGADVHLNELPLIQAATGEPQGIITAGLTFWEAPQKRLLTGRFPLVRLDANRLAAFGPPREPASEEPTPVAIVLGGDPALWLAACAPLPVGFDVHTLAGVLRTKPLDMVKCRTNDLEVPADAEFVLEGFWDPTQAPVQIGPLTDSVGNYSPARLATVIRVTAITHRANPVFPAVIPGRPPSESSETTRLMAQVVLPLLRLAIPGLVDFEAATFGGGRDWVVISLRKESSGEAVRMVHAFWGFEPVMAAKFLVVVDAGVDVRDEQAVLAAIAANASPDRDAIFAAGQGGRMAIDATTKLAAERGADCLGPAVRPEALRNAVAERWLSYGLGAE